MVTLIVILLLSACGSAPSATDTKAPASGCYKSSVQINDRQVQLANVGILGRQSFKAVSLENGLDGQIKAGTWLLGSEFMANVSSTANYVFSWTPRPGVQISTSLPRSKVQTITEEYTPEHPSPEIQFIFTKNWLNTSPQDENSYVGGARCYSEEELLQPNLFLEGNNDLIIVRVYLSASDQVMPKP